MKSVLKEIEVFVAVADARSFSAAAERLRLPKSSVSDGVRSLEDRLGTRLLDRTTRSVRLTASGEAFAARCRRILLEYDDAEEEARRLEERAVGRLRVAAPESLARLFLVPCLEPIMAEHPDLHVEIVAEARFVRLIEEGFDLAIRVAQAIAAPLVGIELGVQRLIVVGSPDYLARHGVPQEAAALADHRVVSTAHPLPGSGAWEIDGGRWEGSSRLSISSAASLRAAALEGQGLAFVPDWLVRRDVEQGALVRLLPDAATPTYGVYGVRPADRPLSRASALFLDAVRREMRRQGVPEA